MEVINLFGEVGSSITLDKVKAEVEAIKGDIQLNVMSEGGSVFEGFAIYNYLKSTKRIKQANIVGLCASIATLIVNAADRVVMSPVSTYMIHNPVLFLTGGDENKLQKDINALNNIKKILSEQYIRKTGKQEEIINAWMNEEKWFTPKEALEAGFIDGIEESILKAVATLYPKNLEMNKDEQMSFMQSLKEDFKKFMNSFKDVKDMALTLESGQKIFVDGDELVGSNVYLADEQGEKQEEAAPDGVHILNDGRSIKVEEGIISEVMEPEEEESPEDIIKQLKEENEKLKAAMDESEKEKEEAEAKAAKEIEAKQKDLDAKEEAAKEMQAKIEKLSNVVFGKPGVKTPADNTEGKKEHKLDSLAEGIKAQFKRIGKI